VVVFTSINADVDHTEHTALFKRMVERAESYEGYLGIEAARNPNGCGVAVVTLRVKCFSVHALGKTTKLTQLIPVFTKYARSHPQLLNEKAAVVAFQAMQSAFSCD
jgi:hypothetical protein